MGNFITSGWTLLFLEEHTTMLVLSARMWSVQWFEGLAPSGWSVYPFDSLAEETRARNHVCAIFAWDLFYQGILASGAGRIRISLFLPRGALKSKLKACDLAGSVLRQRQRKWQRKKTKIDTKTKTNTPSGGSDGIVEVRRSGFRYARWFKRAR